MSSDIEKRFQQVVFDEKWHKLIRKSRLFRFTPFVEFALGSGSMAIGNVTKDSDLDVLIGARAGRIFTARFFAAAFFALFGWRRSKLDHRESASDKICLNHFLTPASYKLSIAPNEYWKFLYQHLVPVYGSAEAIQNFFNANEEWMSEKIVQWHDSRYKFPKPTKLKLWVEKILSGGFGNWLEKRLKAFQVKRIERGLKERKPGVESHLIKAGTGSKKLEFALEPLIHYSDDELQFHPDPAKIELYL